MLYLVATPIGNLSDLSFRAIETLKKCDYILCEDTRHSGILLKHFEIEKPLKSYHKFNETERASKVIEDLKQGMQIALISDAGTPGISDPSQILVKLCIDHQIEVCAIPGPCAAIQALVASGLPSDRFQFWGFLPKKDKELKFALTEILSYKGTTICYESPQRIQDTLQMLVRLDKERSVVVARELTKLHEEYLRGSVSSLLETITKKPPKGEIVLLIGPFQEVLQTSTLTPEEEVMQMERNLGVTRSEAIKLVAELRNVPKREIYNLFHKN